MNSECVRSSVVVSVLGLTLALASGCAGLQVKYKPSEAAAPPASGAVAVQVVDGRSAERQQNKAEVGQVRGGFGIPQGLKDSDANVVARTVTEATGDALRLAGLGATGGGKTLVGTVTEFWMDGFVGYKAGVTVTYTLQGGAGGPPLWTQEIKGAAGGSTFGASGPNAMAEKLFAAALSDLANKASVEFKSAAFADALKR
jgi:hypothetical protein